MRSLTALSIIAIIIGCAILAFSVASGEAEVGLFIIFPYVAAHGAISALGVGLVFLGVLLFFFSIVSSVSSYRREADFEGMERAAPKVKKESRIGGVVMIGPVPIIFGSDKRIARGMIILAIILMVLMIGIYSLILLF